MHQEHKRDLEFETRFYESVLRRNRSYVDVIELLGGLYTKQGRVAEGLKMDRRLVRLQPRNATAHYNLACSLVLSKRKADALRSLHRAIELGYTDLEWMQQDTDLEGLKGNPEFERLLQRLKSQS